VGELINFEEYRSAKQLGIPVKQLREERRMAAEVIASMLQEGVEDEYVHALDYRVRPGYEYILAEDLDADAYRDCKHNKWGVIEENYQAQCLSCGIMAWSAPW
jgi:predicted component of type VI protein secretion system